MAVLNIEGIFPFLTTLISFMFFLSVTEQYLRKRKLHQLVWAISMFLFMVTAGAEGFSLLVGYWDPIIYKIYYLLASIQVSIMGAGALYLFSSRNIINERNSGIIFALFGILWTFFAFIFQFRASVFLWIFIPALLITMGGAAYSIQLLFRDQEKTFTISGKTFVHFFFLFTCYIFIFMVLTAVQAPLDIDYLLNSGGQEVGGHGWVNDLPGLRATIRLFSPLNTVPGAIALIGGAFYSYLMWQWAIKKKTGHFEPYKGFFNIYIGGGALALSIAGTLSGFGFGVLYLGEAVSIALMYFGFLESDKITLQKIVDVLTLGWLRHPEQQETQISSLEN